MQLLRWKSISFGLIALLVSVGITWAATQLSPPPLNWPSASQITLPTPVSLIGYDSGTGSPCIVGSTATCQLATTPGGSSSQNVVVVSALPAGGNLIGATTVYGRIELTPTVQNAPYSSGNDIGGLMSFSLQGSGSGLLQSVAIQFIGGAIIQLNCTFFDANPTGSTFTDKSTFTIAAADESKRINKVMYGLSPTAQTGDAVTSASVDNLAQPFNATSTIYAACASTGTFTPASTTDLRVALRYGQTAK